ncbi:hypothetical protein DOY81_009128 [Sarcophaga bullata]|nr:hypothetical protein DOY81_009128 [Sarcophaga bullata]
MNLNQIHRLLILSSMLCYKIIHGNNSEEAKKWHIFGETLHYIEVEQKYDTYDAFHFCRGIGMINYIGYAKMQPILANILRVSMVSYVPSLWSANQDHCDSDRKVLLLRKEMQSETKFEFVSCSAKYGFVCSTNILNGEIQLKNGTQLSISRDEVIKYCDPQAGDAFDQQNCLIIGIRWK